MGKQTSDSVSVVRPSHALRDGERESERRRSRRRTRHCLKNTIPFVSALLCAGAGVCARVRASVWGIGLPRRRSRRLHSEQNAGCGGDERGRMQGVVGMSGGRMRGVVGKSGGVPRRRSMRRPWRGRRAGSCRAGRACTAHSRTTCADRNEPTHRTSESESACTEPTHRTHCMAEPPCAHG